MTYTPSESVLETVKKANWNSPTGPYDEKAWRRAVHQATTEYREQGAELLATGSAIVRAQKDIMQGIANAFGEPKGRLATGLAWCDKPHSIGAIQKTLDAAVAGLSRGSDLFNTSITGATILANVVGASALTTNATLREKVAGYLLDQPPAPKSTTLGLAKEEGGGFKLVVTFADTVASIFKESWGALSSAVMKPDVVKVVIKQNGLSSEFVRNQAGNAFVEKPRAYAQVIEQPSLFSSEVSKILSEKSAMTAQKPGLDVGR